MPSVSRMIPPTDPVNHMKPITSMPLREATSAPETANTTAARMSKKWTRRNRFAESTNVVCIRSERVAADPRQYASHLPGLWMNPLQHEIPRTRGQERAAAFLQFWNERDDCGVGPLRDTVEPVAATPAFVLAINAGSSSIKFAVYDAGRRLTPTLRGQLDRIGLEGTTLSWTMNSGSAERHLDARNREAATGLLIEWLETQDVFGSISAVGHRLVHGLARTEPAQITSDVLAELHRATPYAPDHLPREIEMIEGLRHRYPDLMQVACFDTAFHSGMPSVAKLVPIPRRYYTKGVRRYGFHGLSYAYLLEELARIAGPEAANGRVILAHLGNGASLAAVKEGRSIDTSMGFTPAAGLVMSTRTGRSGSWRRVLSGAHRGDDCDRLPPNGEPRVRAARRIGTQFGYARSALA